MRAPASGEHAQPRRVDHLVGQQEVFAQSRSHHPLHLADGGAGEPGVARRGLAARQRRALVRLHVRTHPTCPAGPRPWCGGWRPAGARPPGALVSSAPRSSCPARYRPTTITGERRGVLVRAVDEPWLGDACSLVEAFRARELSPLEALDASIAAMEASPLNAFSFTDFDRAREAARRADVSLPFGGVPFGVKELEKVEGWPYTEASDDLPGPGRRPRRHVAGSPAHQRGRAGRPDDGPGVRGHQLHVDRVARDDAQPVEPRRAPRAGRRGARRRRSPADCCRSRREATVVGPSGARRASAGCSASRRPTGGSRKARTAPSSR